MSFNFNSIFLQNLIVPLGIVILIFELMLVLFELYIFSMAFSFLKCPNQKIVQVHEYHKNKVIHVVPG